MTLERRPPLNGLYQGPPIPTGGTDKGVKMTDHDHFDLCIVGAGYAGLSAAFVASRYLPATARVLVLDKHQQAASRFRA